MNLARVRRSDDSGTAEEIMRRMTPAEWIKIFILVGGFVASFFVLRAQVDERWDSQKRRDDLQDKARQEDKADVVKRLDRIEDGQLRILEAQQRILESTASRQVRR